MINCRDADELDKTRRVMGDITNLEFEKLRHHAIECPRDDWYHAVPHSVWDITQRERERIRRAQAMGRVP